MSPRGPRPKNPGGGPRYYRVPSAWGLLFALIVVILLIVALFRLG